MDHLQFLFAGFAVFWAAILVYLLVLQGRVRSLEREISRLEERLAENEDATQRADANPGSDAERSTRASRRSAEPSSPTT